MIFSTAFFRFFVDFGVPERGPEFWVNLLFSTFVASQALFGPHNRCLIDFGSILGRFLVDFRTFLGRSGNDFFDCLFEVGAEFLFIFGWSRLYRTPSRDENSD